MVKGGDGAGVDCSELGGSEGYGAAEAVGGGHEEGCAVGGPGKVRVRRVDGREWRGANVGKTHQVRSVKVAKWRLLTTQRGVCCCVS